MLHGKAVALPGHDELVSNVSAAVTALLASGDVCTDAAFRAYSGTIQDIMRDPTQDVTKPVLAAAVSLMQPVCQPEHVAFVSAAGMFHFWALSRLMECVLPLTRVMVVALRP